MRDYLDDIFSWIYFSKYNSILLLIFRNYDFSRQCPVFVIGSLKSS